MGDNERVEWGPWQDPMPQEDQLEQSQPVGPVPERAPLSRSADVPEADALEQAQEVEPGPRPGRPRLGFEVPEADAWDQATDIPIDDDYIRADEDH